MQNYIGKLNMIKWNRFETDYKNEWVIFTHWISFTGPLLPRVNKHTHFLIPRMDKPKPFEQALSKFRFFTLLMIRDYSSLVSSRN